ncbi:hypothetical protein LR48_Vigan11g041500 [Vigna angularis]|uniref:Uncharacterized protein n=1 Tax=Phaseolus angularis TaxID=3914 RepID=A0A0L9VR78_PHAAN|nr:hypothetical protein LR48_Vigan11g041500 [Vigna angularis]
MSFGSTSYHPLSFGLVPHSFPAFGLSPYGLLSFGLCFNLCSGFKCVRLKSLSLFVVRLGSLQLFSVQLDSSLSFIARFELFGLDMSYVLGHALHCSVLVITILLGLMFLVTNARVLTAWSWS